jgi:F-type H+-transporting ATPase subunit delta
MADLTTVARPYARAAFEYARTAGELAQWSEALELVAMIAADEAVRPLLGDPHLDEEQRVSIFTGVAGERLTAGMGNFIRLLAANGRLEALPEIALLYTALRAGAEGSVEAVVTSAAELDDQQRERIVAALSQRLGRSVTLQCSVDESLIGGAVIRAGDLVIDGSVHARLGKLSGALRH